MATPNVNNSGDSQEIQDYINAIEAQYNAAEQYIQAMEQDSSAIEHDATQISVLKPQERTHWSHVAPDGQGGATVITGWNTHQSVINEVNNLQGDIAVKQADIQAKQAQLEKVDPDFSALDNTLDSIIDSLTKTLNDGVEGHGRIADDVSHIQKYLTSLFKAMQDKIQVDKNQAIIQGNQSSDLTDAQLEQFASAAIQAQGSELNNLNEMVNTMSADFGAYHKQYDDANTDHHRFNIFDEIFSDANAKEYEDDRVENNANDMMNAINSALTAVAPEIAACTPGLGQIEMIFDVITRKIDKILADTTLSPKEKSTKILALLMFALGAFSQLHQQVESLKSNNEKQMSQANLYAAQMNLDDSVMNQKIQQEEQANAKIMKTFMLVTQIVLGTLMTLAAPGVGSAFAMAVATALEASGVIDTITTKLGEAFHSKIGADIFVAALEVGATAGGGFGLDLLAQKVGAEAVEVAVEAAVATAKEAVEEAAEKAALAAGRAGDRAAIEAAQNVIEGTAKTAAEAAAKKTVQAFTSQTIPALVSTALKKGLMQSVKEALTKATEQAVTTAISDANLIAEAAARGATITATEMNTVALRAANEAVADVSKVALQNVAKETGKSEARKLGERAVFAVLYSIGNTSLLIDIAKERLKDPNSESSQELLMALGIIQGLMMMFAQIGGSGIAAMFDASSANMELLMNRIALIPQGMNVGANLGQYYVYKDEADTVEKMQITSSSSDVLQALMDQIKKDASQSRDLFIRAQAQEVQQNLAMSTHLHDGDAAGIQVLTSGAA
jgi:putative ubiquitin-RnfH superfamily antitoxin RatB of RatAB toxin-antitoxin module